MAVKNIVLYAEHPEILRETSKPIPRLSREVKQLARDLRETLSAHPEGIGLAAPQIGAHSRVVVVRLGGGPGSERKPDPPLPLINPEIVEADDERQDFDGCLSFPGLYGQTVRPHHLRVTGLDEQGHLFDRVFEGFDAVLVHHELDHLDGVLFIDRIENLEDLYYRRGEHGRLVRISLTEADVSRL